MTFTCQLPGEVLEIPEWLPKNWAKRFGPDPDPVAVVYYESKEKSLVILRDAQQRIGQKVKQISDARLDEPFPDKDFLAVFPTVRHALTQALVGHTANHVGQISVWRKAAGLPPFGRSFV